MPPVMEHFLFPSTDVYVMCIHTHFPDYAANIEIVCPVCGQKEGIQLNGWSNGFRACIGKSSLFLMKSRRLLHYHCPIALANNKTSTSFSSIHPKVVMQYPPIVQEMLPFRVLNKLVIHRQLIQEIREGKMSGSISSIQRTHASLMQTQYMQNFKHYLLAVKRVKTHPSLRHFMGNYRPKPFPSFDQLPVKPISTTTMTKLYKDEVRRLLPLIHGYTGLLTGEVLKWDHTFWVARLMTDANGVGSKTCVFSVMNEYGEVLASYFCESKSLNELRKEVQMLKVRLLQGGQVKLIYTDNPGGDLTFIHSVFGQNTIVKRDNPKTSIMYPTCHLVHLVWL